MPSREASMAFASDRGSMFDGDKDRDFSSSNYNKPSSMANHGDFSKEGYM